MKVYYLLQLGLALFTSTVIRAQNNPLLKNGGVPCAIIDLRSDTLLLKSYIGNYSESELLSLKKFLQSNYVTSCNCKKSKHYQDSISKNNEIHLDSLKKIAPHIDYCLISYGDISSDAPDIFATKFSKKIIIPLLKFVNTCGAERCQMCVDFIRKDNKEIKK